MDFGLGIHGEPGITSTSRVDAGRRPRRDGWWKTVLAERPGGRRTAARRSC